MNKPEITSNTLNDKPKWSLIGPGLIVAATGVGAGDLVAALVAGTKYGLTFLWAILLGILLKFALNEGVGRYSLATGQTFLEGLKSLGKWATGYFGVYTLIWGFVYGAAATSSCALAAKAFYPAIPFWVYAVLHALIGCLLVLTNKYNLFEKVMSVLIGFMFVTVIGAAILVIPNLAGILSTGIPKLPDGSLIYALGLMGGLGGSITMASYGYWLAEKRWDSKHYIKVMRIDAFTAYLLTGLFSLALLILGAAMLYGTDTTISGEAGLVDFAKNLGNELNPAVRYAFLFGFWSASFTSVLGVWNGVSYLFADFMRTLSASKEKKIDKRAINQTKSYKFYVLWLTFPPMLLHFFGEPVFLIIIYGALGAVFMPFLAIILMILLNSKKIDPLQRNHWLANTILCVNVIIFAVLMVNELISLF